MPEFKIKCGYIRKEKRKFFNNEKEKDYHRFLVKNPEAIPDKYLSKWKEKFKESQVNSWIFVADELLKKLGINDIKEERKQNYRFILRLGEEKAAKFMPKNPKNSQQDNFPWHNNMVLKTEEYWKNTVQRIGFWESENYFYESKKNPEKPIKKSNNRPTQPENKSDWGKIALVCLPIVIVAFFFFLMFWMSKKKK